MLRSLIAAVVLLLTVPAWATYDLPNNDADCPGNCRRIPWSAGSDQWNGGALPTYPSVTCTGLTEGDGTTDNRKAIQACITAATPNTAVYIPAGIYYVNGSISLKSGVVLRGAGGGSPWLPGTSTGTTTLKLGTGGRIIIGSGAKRGKERVIRSGYTKGSTTLVMASGHGFAAGDWISVFEDGDSAIPTNRGGCKWCGENNGSKLIQQFVKVTSVAGNTITISRPMYYAYAAGNNPGAKKMTWGIQYAGIEDLKLNGWSDSRTAPFISLNGALFSWVKGVETYNASSTPKAGHVMVQWSHGCEIRDGYYHFGRASNSDRNYGVYFFFWNSDHKVENNVLRHHRHSLSFEGGGSGIAVLYNYIDDNYTEDLTYLGSARTNHGAHPMMNLWEGNIASHIEGDAVWGTASHNVFFRNHLWGDETGTDVPGFSLQDGGYAAVHVASGVNYFSFINNVLGTTGKAGTWSNAKVRPVPPCSPYSASPSSPTVYCYGSSTAASTSINHGNWDYKTQGVAYWEGGTDQVFSSSIYYDVKPSWWCPETPWPPIGSDLSPLVTDIPAKVRFGGGTCARIDSFPGNGDDSAGSGFDSSVAIRSFSWDDHSSLWTHGREQYAKIRRGYVRWGEGIQGEVDGISREGGGDGRYPSRQADRPGCSRGEGIPRRPAPGDRDGPEGFGCDQGESLDGFESGRQDRLWLKSSSTPTCSSRQHTAGSPWMRSAGHSRPARCSFLLPS